ncbi:MAG TPA: rRNA maturation RNase YbeY [Phycisphaerae bacterium]|nr:rRNA maturation RNase YbeY [Phycisphaerae bacterium]HOB76548.1 rRNA maturation RNase YbeY [Phycisphaerae bacterium]HOJ56557.1 rRNA maturation RNase YbeY [Phycisphaerae bacterium]HOL28347.1 rRNA maturation RNase YbeY [Phycisphaerae bacterium]HPP19933.1 rRNA maturation RNase YbeY [Phycisphaerae bacterium]
MRKRKQPLPTGGRKGRITVRRLTRDVEVSARQVAAAARAALGDRPMRALSVVLVDDDAIADLHERFMGLPGPTDVLTFDLRDDPDQAEIEGEITISVDTARRQARQYRAGQTEELLRYVIHGVLHLSGYDDDTPARRRRMRREENRVLELLGIRRQGLRRHV